MRKSVLTETFGEGRALYKLLMEESYKVLIGLTKRDFTLVELDSFTGVTVALYPVSIVKTRLQVASKDIAERSPFSVIKGILKNDGVPGHYRGFGTVIIGAVPARIIFLTALKTRKISAFKLVAPFEFSEPTQAASANGMAGMTASLYSQAVLVPIDVVSQKFMCRDTQVMLHILFDVATKIIKSFGVRGLYKGFGLSVMTYSPSACQLWIKSACYLEVDCKNLVFLFVFIIKKNITHPFVGGRYCILNFMSSIANPKAPIFI